MNPILQEMFVRIRDIGGVNFPLLQQEANYIETQFETYQTTSYIEMALHIMDEMIPQPTYVFRDIYFGLLISCLARLEEHRRETETSAATVPDIDDNQPLNTLMEEILETHEGEDVTIPLADEVMPDQMVPDNYQEISEVPMVCAF